MRAVVTRVKEASVTIDGQVNGAIKQGYLVLLGVGPDDSEQEAAHLADKIVHLRVFEDENGKMNRNLEQVEGDILVVSQFISKAVVRDFLMLRRLRSRSRCMKSLWRICGIAVCMSSTANSARICRLRPSMTVP